MELPGLTDRSDLLPDPQIGTTSRASIAADLAALAIASFLVYGMFWVVNNTSHTPSAFSWAQLILFYAAFAAAYLLIIRKISNVHCYGVPALFVAACGGASLYNLLSTLYLALTGESGLSGNQFGNALISAVVAAILIFVIAFVVRLFTLPITSHFRQ